MTKIYRSTYFRIRIRQFRFDVYIVFDYGIFYSAYCLKNLCPYSISQQADMENKIQHINVLFCMTIFLSVLHSVDAQCALKVKEEQIQDTYMQLLQASSTKILRITLKFDVGNVPESTNWRLYEPGRWDITTGITGMSILTSHPDIGFFSMGFFNLEIKELQIAITSEPVTCLMNITEQNFVKSVFYFFSSGLKHSEKQNTTILPSAAHVCREEAFVRGSIVTFHQFCCHLEDACAEIHPDFWQQFLFYAIMITGIMAFLYATNLVPSYIYRSKNDYKAFYLDLEAPSTFKVTNNTTDDIETDAVFDKEALQKPKKGIKRMLNLTELVKGGSYKVKGLWLKAKNVRLVSKSHMPISLFIFLYQRLIRCTCYTYRGHSNTRNRTLKTLSGNRLSSKSVQNADNNEFTVEICCNLPICSPPKQSSFRVPSWHSLLRIIMAVMSTVIFLIPWILIYALDDGLPEGQRGKYAFENKLIYHSPVYAFNLLRFVKNHSPGLNFALIVVYLICVIIISVILSYNEDERQYVGKTIRTVLRQAKRRWDKGLMTASKCYVVLLLPFKVLRNYGVVALLLWPMWIAIVCPLTLLFAIFANTPTINVFLRLSVSFIKDIIDIFRKRQYFLDPRLAIERCVLYEALLLALFLVNLLVYALMSLLVNIVAYTLAGMIVTANETFRYTSFALFILMNAFDTFQSVEKRYSVFNEKLHAVLLSKTRDQIKQMAKRELNNQPNMAYRLKTEMDDKNNANTETLWKDIAISGNNKILLDTKSVVQFLDKHDKVFLSEKFFFEACYMDYYGCPGDFPTNLLNATGRVLIIVLFLVFVLFTLNAFGSIESFTASGLLITLSWGLLPTLINRFFSKPMAELSLDTNDYNFQNKLDSLIHDFSEYWEVVDLDVEEIHR